MFSPYRSLVLVAALCFGFVGMATAQNSSTFPAAPKRIDLSFLDKHVLKNGKIEDTSSVWENATFKAAMEQVLGKEGAKVVFSDWVSESGGSLVQQGVRKESGVFITSANKAHSAITDSIVVFVSAGGPEDPAQNMIQACFKYTDARSHKQIVTWAAMDPKGGKPSVRFLPSTGCNADYTKEMLLLEANNRGSFGTR